MWEVYGCGGCGVVDARVMEFIIMRWDVNANAVSEWGRRGEGYSRRSRIAEQSTLSPT